MRKVADTNFVAKRQTCQDKLFEDAKTPRLKRRSYRSCEDASLATKTRSCEDALGFNGMITVLTASALSAVSMTSTASMASTAPAALEASTLSAQTHGFPALTTPAKFAAS